MIYANRRHYIDFLTFEEVNGLPFCYFKDDAWVTVGRNGFATDDTPEKSWNRWYSKRCERLLAYPSHVSYQLVRDPLEPRLEFVKTDWTWEDTMVRGLYKESQFGKAKTKAKVWEKAQQKLTIRRETPCNPKPHRIEYRERIGWWEQSDHSYSGCAFSEDELHIPAWVLREAEAVEYQALDSNYYHAR